MRFGGYRLRSVVALLLASAVPVAAVAARDGPPPQAPSAPPPELSVELSPSRTANGQRLGVQLKLARPGLKAGEALLRMPTMLVGTPTAAYDAAAIVASDAKGRLVLTANDEDKDASGQYRRYLVDRPTEGDVTVAYSAAPRAVNAETRNGPLFDLRAEGEGLIGSGVWFFAVPPGPTPYNIKLQWKLPSNERGISSRGEGDAQWIGPAETLPFSFYATGPVKSSPEDGKGDFTFYYLNPPPFDVDKLSSDTKKIYEVMARFFGDEGKAYRVFARQNPYPSGGGTSLGYSFMFGYGAGGATTDGGSLMLIAHEMAHTWPKMTGAHPLTAWYSEGSAEYYSLLLSYRAGTIDLDRFLEIANGRAEAYYTGPFRTLSNEETGKIFWSDARAQRVPYERGFMYLAKLDGQMRAKSAGKKRVDDLVLDVLRRQRAGEDIGVAQWREMVVAELGEAAGKDFDDMAAGKQIIPPATTFGPCFKLVKTTSRPFDLGFDQMRLAVVSDLRTDSSAAKAGLREGDQIVSMTPLDQALKVPDGQIIAVVRRGRVEEKIAFKPRGAEVEAWRWERVSNVPEAECQL